MVPPHTSASKILATIYRKAVLLYLPMDMPTRPMHVGIARIERQMGNLKLENNR